ncbi:MAG: hypothetical protein EZS28_031502 [Streblomastix strix]|uniref:Uncharacterized protein n=1 Tax=Streblomastix strix TaxID=222440 RepID=A0A5J4US01_9EUKA|nr:MAG: hypothetical protein EZS28_031502 [Streblomastix strix]
MNFWNSFLLLMLSTTFRLLIEIFLMKIHLSCFIISFNIGMLKRIWDKNNFKFIIRLILQIEKDTSQAAYNFNRGSAAVTLAKFVDRTLETAEVFNLQLRAFHIPGVTNRISDSISRLATSVSYSLHQEVFEQALRLLKIRPSIDMFANRKNRKLKRFANLILDSQAMGQDCLSLTWK